MSGNGVWIVTTSTSALEYREMSKPALGKDKKQTLAPRPLRIVTINGGANISAGIGLVTPKGVTTRISEADYSWLKEDESFKRHVKNGFMKVLEGDAEPNANGVAGSMKKFDGSAPQNVDSGNAKVIPQAAEG